MASTEMTPQQDGRSQPKKPSPSPQQHVAVQAAQPDPTKPEPAQTAAALDSSNAATHPGLDQTALKQALLHPQGAYGRVEVVDSAGSTNTELAAAASDPAQHWPDLSVLIANAQPAGKGRLGRSWEVPAGAAMISSVLVWPADRSAEQSAPGTSASAGARTGSASAGARTGSASAGASAGASASTGAKPFEPSGYGWLSILAGVALCQALRSETGVPATLKWPNDVVVDGRKVAGILAQVVPATVVGPRAQAGAGVVVGTGVNVSLKEKELPTARATSLLVEGVPAPQLDRNKLLPAYLNNFARFYGEFRAVGGDARATLPAGGSVLCLAKEFMSTLGQEVRAELPGGTMLFGTAVDLNSDGSLRLRDAEGAQHNVSAGDVLHLRRTGPDGAVGYA